MTVAGAHTTDCIRFAQEGRVAALSVPDCKVTIVRNTANAVCRDTFAALG